MDKFLKDLEVRNYSPETLRKYAHCLRRFLAWLTDKKILDLKKVGRVELRNYAETLKDNPKFSLHHVGANIRAIKCFFKFLRKTGVTFYDFSVVLKEPRLSGQLPKEPLTLKEVEAMLEAPDMRTEFGVRDRAILETFYSCGLRVSEMARLGMVDLNLEDGLLFVRMGKGQKDRVVPLGTHACFFIQNYLDVRSRLMARNLTITDRLWVNRWGKPLEKADINRMVRLYAKKQGLGKQVTPHSFRRTLAVELIRNQCDFLSVKSILGHSKSETTLRYCVLSGVELKDALRESHPRYDGEADTKPEIKSRY